MKDFTKGGKISNINSLEKLFVKRKKYGHMSSEELLIAQNYMSLMMMMNNMKGRLRRS
jgi:hypothetical protein